MPAIFILAAFFGLLSIVSVLLIPAEAIDDRVARGLEEDGDGGGKVSGLKVLVECKPLLILAAALVSILIWVFFSKILKAACDNH